jgi:hypothetical protein
MKKVKSKFEGKGRAYFSRWFSQRPIRLIVVHRVAESYTFVLENTIVIMTVRSSGFWMSSRVVSMRESGYSLIERCFSSSKIDFTTSL